MIVGKKEESTGLEKRKTRQKKNHIKDVFLNRRYIKPFAQTKIRNPHHTLCSQLLSLGFWEVNTMLEELPWEDLRSQRTLASVGTVVRVFVFSDSDADLCVFSH